MKSVVPKISPTINQRLSKRYLLRKGELARLPRDSHEEALKREPDEIFKAIFPETREDEGVTGSD